MESFARDLAVIEAGQSARRVLLAIGRNGLSAIERVAERLGVALEALPWELAGHAQRGLDAIAAVVRTAWRHLATAAGAGVDVGVRLLCTPDGRRRLTVALLFCGAVPALLLLGGCRFLREEEESERRVHAIICVDTSSTFAVCDGKRCEPQAVSSAFRALAQYTRVPAGLTVEVCELGDGPNAKFVAKKQAQQRWPRRAARQVAKNAFVQQTAAELDALVFSTDGFSDYVQSTWFLGNRFAETGGTERYLILVGDGRDERHAAANEEGWNLAYGVLEGEGAKFAEARVNDKTLPSLPGVTVVACGLHFTPTPDVEHIWSVTDHLALVELLSAVWTRSGAKGSRALTSCDASAIVQALKEVDDAVQD